MSKRRRVNRPLTGGLPAPELDSDPRWPSEPKAWYGERMCAGADIKPVKVVGVSAVGGGGKTAITRRLAESLGDAIALHFDDYDDSNIHPEDLHRWFRDGANYDAYETPVFTCHLQTLKAGRSVHHPIGGSVGPAGYVVADAPLGRAHSDSGRFIDLMVFIDTPLDVAMTRRVLRDIERETEWTADEALQRVKSELSGYEAGARPIYEHFQQRMRAGSDLIVNGTLSTDLLVEKIRSEMRSRWGDSVGTGWVRERVMDDDLAKFLRPLTPFAEQMVTWTTGTMRLECYLTDRPPPRRYVTSARAIVTDGDRVLVVYDPTGRHIMPGGRLEPGETPEDALRREMMEETGCSLASYRPIGILHYTHTEAVPEGWIFPHPDFLQIVYAGSLGEYHPELREEDEFVLGSEFMPIAEARRMPLNAGQQVFLDAALGECP